MATIKQIDGRTVHQIQSGQVIVDLCSVVKELVENSIDAGASNVEVRFKNQGLDSIEIQDNGAGIAPANYASVALKHHTSKLSSYADISSLETFGFRGEALASLCALSTLTITTCLPEDVPKGSKLVFEASGKLKGTSVVAAQKGTTVAIEKLFHNLPVRRRELERNIKREWHKVIALLNQYACIQTNLKFTVSQQPSKGKRIVLFSTKGNATTRDNIINIFGAKTMTALIPLQLNLEMQPSTLSPALQPGVDLSSISNTVRVVGHVSRPAHGEGRQTPDRQMFFVNGRPCGLPQFSKTFNEVYKSYNSTQSPFIFADIQLDTHMYDVNVSPDKRTILLHDQNQLLDTIRTSLTDLFDSHDYTVPTSQLMSSKNTPNKKSLLSTIRDHSTPGKPEVTTDPEPPPRSEDTEGEDSPMTQVPQRGYSESQTKQSPSFSNLNQWVQKGSAAGRVNEVSTSTTTGHFSAVYGHSSQKTSDDDVSDTALGKDDSCVSNPEHGSGDEQESEMPVPTRKFTSWLAGSDADSTPTPGNAGTQLKPTQTTPLKSSSQLHEEPSIPVIQPLRTPQPSGLGLAQRSAAKRGSPEPASILIGDLDSDTKHHGRPSKRMRTSKNSDDDEEDDGESGEDDEGECEDRGQDEIEDDDMSDHGRPSFGTSLSKRFSAGQARRNTPADAYQLPTRLASEPSDSENEAELPNAPDMEPPSDRVPDSPDDSIYSATIDKHEPETEEVETESKKPRARSFQSNHRRKDATLQSIHNVTLDETVIRERMQSWSELIPHNDRTAGIMHEVEDIAAADAESKLSLIISKSDFANMRVAGQFNLGFIIAVRPASKGHLQSDEPQDDELFIIDQHASDEKFNFERLQDTTVVQSQRLVHPKRLELTALEEEIVMQNIEAIEANGFKIVVETDGTWPVGSRCQLVSLPLSRETTFNITDLEELIALLGEESSESRHIPRPSKVRKMFAMRACRSSIMIGKALTQSQMYSVVGHMGELNKPWNCPHGRPTMRHLCKMQMWDEKGWNRDLNSGSQDIWKTYGQS